MGINRPSWFTVFSILFIYINKIEKGTVVIFVGEKAEKGILLNCQKNAV